MTSTDLNPTGHLWDVVEQEIWTMNVQPTNLQQLQISLHFLNKGGNTPEIDFTKTV